jgi:competence protein ComEC
MTGPRVAWSRIASQVVRHPWHVASSMLAAGLAAPAVASGRTVAVAVAALCGGGLTVWLVDGGSGVAETHRPRRPDGYLAVLALLAFACGAALGDARLAALDAPAARVVDGARLTGRAFLLSHPRPSPFGSSAELRMTSGRLDGVSLLARLPRWAPDLDDLPIGVELRVHGTSRSLQRIAAEDRSREFQVARWLQRNGLAGELQADVASPTGRFREGRSGALDRMRARAEEGVTAGLRDDRAALLRGMVLGQDEAISEPVREEFRAAGLSHILAVSGQNVMLLVALALPVLMVAGLGARARSLTLLVLIGLYVPLAGAGSSLQRAAVMGTAGVAATLAARPASRSYGLLLAAVVTLGLNPRAVTDPGWQLSFVAVAGILLLGRPLSEALREGIRALVPDRRASSRALSSGPHWIERALIAFADGVALTVAATLATAPLLAHHFGAVSLAALPTNIPALPVVAPAMWLGMLKVAVGQLSVLGVPPQPLSHGLGRLATVPLAAIATLAERLATLPHAQLRLKLRSPVAVGGGYAVMAIALLGLRSAMPPLIARVGEAGSRWRRMAPARRGALVAVATALVALAAARSLAPPRPVEALTVRFLDVGQGDATLLQHPDGTAILFDSGPPEGDVARLLRRAGVHRLALVVATHMSRDHHGGLLSVLRSFPVGMLLDGGDGTRDHDFRIVEAEADRRGIRRVPALAPLRLRVGAFDVRVLSPAPRPPGPPPDDPNPRAATTIVSVDGFDMLLSGDAESPTLSTLDLPDVDAIKVPHHGSSDPGLPAVLERLGPEVAGIEVGRHNTYGHPAPSTLTALRRAGVRTFRTDRDGTVTLTVEHGDLSVSTER